MDKINAHVFRFNPEEDYCPKLKKYEIETETPMVVNNILRYIQENIDSTLAYRNYFCLSGICGSCFVNVNGKRVRGCQTKVNPGEEVVIEPQEGYPIIRDVVTDFGIEVSGPNGNFNIKKGTTVDRK